MSRTVVVEGWWADDWQALTPWNGAGVRIRTGARDEARALVPAQATLTLNASASEPLNPAHPASALFGAAGRNTPVRIAVRYGATSGALTDVTDAFGRTEASGWGDPDVGGTWGLYGSGGTVDPTDWSVSSGAGQIDVPAADADRVSIQDAAAVADLDVAVTITAEQATGADRDAGIALRQDAGLNGVYAYLRLTTAHDVIVTIVDYLGSTMASTTTAITHTGQALRLRVRAAGLRIAARCWDPSGAEPDSWDAVSLDYSRAPYTGRWGLKAGRSTGNTNTSSPVAFDDLASVCDDPRIDGEAASWQPVRNPGDPYRTQLTISGVLRRWSQPDQPLDSAILRGLSERGDLLSYWPLEDGADASAAGTATAGGVPASASGITFGQDPGNLAGAASVAKLPNGAALAGIVTAAPSADDWTIQVWVKLAATPASGTNIILRIGQIAGGIADWQIAVANLGFTCTAADASGSTVDSSSAYYVIDPTEWFLLRLHVYASGSDLKWDLSWWAINDTDVWIMGPRTVSSTAVGRPLTARLQANSITAGWYASHWLVSDGDVPIYADQIPLGTAWAGEAAGDRVIRLAGESGLAAEVVNDATSVLMGAQTITTLAGLLDEINLADGGIVAEPPGWPGIRFRPASDLYSQTPALSLAMDDQSVAPGLAPVIDDQAAENDVTAERPNGGTFRSVLTSGPMSTASPVEGGIGAVKVKRRPNVASDTLLPGWAGWRRHVGTTPDPRYRVIRTSCERHPELEQSASAVIPGDVLEVAGLDGDDRRVLVLGTEEEFGAAGLLRTIGWVCAPEAPWQVGQVGEDTGGTTSVPSMVGADHAGYSTASTTYDAPLAATIAEGDLVLISIVANTSSGDAVTTPSGTWTDILGGGGNLKVAGGVGYAWYAHLVTAGEAASPPASWQFTLATARTGNVITQLVRGHDTASPYEDAAGAGPTSDATAAVHQAMSGTTSCTVTGVSTSQSNCLLIGCGNLQSATAESVSDPSGWTNDDSTCTLTLGRGQTAGHLALAAAGATGDQTWTRTSALQGASYMLAVAPAPVAHVPAGGTNALDSDGSTLASSWAAGTDTSLSVAVADGHPLWITGDVTLEVIAGGAVASVSSISGSSSPQTFTIAASTVNGITKTVPAGSTVRLHRPNYIGWEGRA